MYWPTGSASRLSHSSTLTTTSISGGSTTPTKDHHHHQASDIPENHPGAYTHGFRQGELIGINSCSATPQAPLGLFATWTTTELTIWNPKPKIAISKLIRSPDSLTRLGDNKDVKWKPDSNEHTLIIWTVNSALIIYRLEPLPKSDSVYNLPPDQSESFLSTGPADRIPFPKLALKFIGEIPPLDPSDVISCLALTPSHILIGIANPIPRLSTISWSSIHSFITLNQRTNRHHHNSLYEDQNLKPNSHSVKSSTKNLLSDIDWLIDKSVTLLSITYSNELNVYILVTSDGRGYVAHIIYSQTTRGRPTRLGTDEEVRWMGNCFHDPVERLGHLPATGACAINLRFSLVAVGVQKGIVDVYSFRGSALLTNYSHSLNPQTNQNDHEPRGNSEQCGGVVNTCAWTSDGHALAVASSNGFSVWSVFGRLQTCCNSGMLLENETTSSDIKFDDYFMGSCRSLLWGPGNFELFLLTAPSDSPTRYIADDQLFVLPFAKSAVATLHSPDNTKHAFLQLDDRVSVYRGADCPDLSVINPESDVWQHIKIPADYISTNWPINYSCISEDGKLLAVAGTRGFTHFNSVSGRWKLFENEDEEQSIHVRGGMQWFENTLVTAVEEGGSYSIRLFARENTLSLSHCLLKHHLSHPIVLLSIYDTSLLIYTTDNTLSHFIIKGQTLIPCGSIGFEGVVGNPLRVRGMSWLIPDTQHCFGEPEHDLDHATIILLIGGKVVLLRPQRSERAEVKYDMQILADHVEFYWAGRQFNDDNESGLLENSLWAWDGKRISVWLDALAIDEKDLSGEENVISTSSSQAVENRLTIPLNFHPLSVLMDKGIFIGIEQETVIKKSLNFALFRIVTNTELFIHQVIKFYLSRGRMKEAVGFGAHYSKLIYFGHSLEILLHTVLEEEADSKTNPPTLQKNTTSSSSTGPNDSTTIHTDANEETTEKQRMVLLPLVAEFLDHFRESLEVVVGCARKIDLKQWKNLFQIVGKPRDLFEKSLDLGLLQVASSYLLILNHYYLDDLSFFDNRPQIVNHDQDHNQDQNQNQSHIDEDHYSIEIICSDTLRLLKIGIEVKNWTLCKEVMRFLFSLDHTGKILRKALKETNINLPIIDDDDRLTHTDSNYHHHHQNDDDQNPPSGYPSIL
ncbi:hypothetical protein PSTG_06849 [Puccinia striiformis f. sp. tritici PST-78]|uniref:RIC1 C-terminal alpha solenoid region domain-containing protein n=1 Tax=Puccinia striiformis f. sp. tritici PST-78 TaxID=1165861 RepID=A0A0L0VL50_9BASI|nr:hypothetical protein PSTG_06849 [Puccinia striiformis f. sp. tritici PST-78]